MFDCKASKHERIVVYIMDERCNINRKLDEYTERLKISTRDWREILPRPIAEELFEHFDNYWWYKYFDLLTAFLKHTRGADKRKKIPPTRVECYNMQSVASYQFQLNFLTPLWSCTRINSAAVRCELSPARASRNSISFKRQ